MRFLHTADWHIGRLFHGIHLTQDQHHLLLQLVDLARQERVDALVVAGDVYDRAVPPPEAVDVVDDILCRFALDLKIPVLLIAGNHDSPQRLAFGQKLLSMAHLHVAGGPSNPVRVVTLADSHGPVHFYLAPYAEPAAVAACLGEACPTHDAAMAGTVKAIAAGRLPGRSVLVGHATVVGGEDSESERPLCIGGAEQVGVGHFSAFNYTALGHLHRPQSFCDGRVRYAGSLMPYSFSEAAHGKSVSLVEINAAGACASTQHTLIPRRRVRCVQGTLQELLQAPRDSSDANDYIQCILTDTTPLLDPMGKLRRVYPNVLSMEYAAPAQPAGPVQVENRTELNEEEIFASFYRDVTGGQITEPLREAYAGIINAARGGNALEGAA